MTSVLHWICAVVCSRAWPGSSLGNSWRISSDCNDFFSIYIAIRLNQLLGGFAGPGGWNVRERNCFGWAEDNATLLSQLRQWR